MPQPQSFPAKPGQNIEPGCLCLIIAGPLAGTPCTALEMKPAGFRYISRPTGELRILTGPAWSVAIPGRQFATLTEAHKLLRVDGHKPEADELSQVLPALTRKGASA